MPTTEQTSTPSAVPLATVVGNLPTRRRRVRVEHNEVATLKQSLEERFWAKVDKSAGPDACWLWTASVNQLGYGTISGAGRDGRNGRAHRVAWELAKGLVPDGMQVCHRCDVRNCCNPAHLFLGTQADNNHDMVAKGRNARVRGDANGSRLHPETRPRGDAHAKRQNPILRARAEAIRGATGDVGEIAAQFGVSRSFVYRIRRGECWGRK